jgi:hypothetical protein
MARPSTARPAWPNWRTRSISRSTTCSRWPRHCNCCALSNCAAELLLTPAARRYAQADVDQRKAMFGEALLAYVPLAQHIRRILDERATHKAPARRFRDELEDHMSEDFAQKRSRPSPTGGATPRSSPITRIRTSSVWMTHNDSHRHCRRGGVGLDRFAWLLLSSACQAEIGGPIDGFKGRGMTGVGVNRHSQRCIGTT